MGTLEYKIGPTNLTQEERVFQQNHKMLWPENYYYYEYCTGGKTGYTDQAKTTLVTMADNGDMHLAAVVLYDYGVDAYTDTRAMMDYVFSNFKKVPVETLETSEDISNFNTENPYVVLPQSVNFSSLEKNIVLTENGIRDGKIIYTYKGQAVGSAEVTLTEEGYQKLMGDTAASDSRKIENKQETQPAPTEPAKDDKAEQPRLKLYVGIGSAAVLLILIIAGSVMLHRKNRNRKE